MPRATVTRHALRAALALAITIAFAGATGFAQTLRGATAPTAPPVTNDSVTVETPPAPPDRIISRGPGGSGALAPPLVFHADPNAFTPLARPVIVPPRFTTDAQFGLPSPSGRTAIGGTPETVSGAGDPIDPPTGTIVGIPAGNGGASGDLLAGPSLRRGPGATRDLNVGSSGAGRIVMPRESFGTTSRFVGDVVITNRDGGRTRIVSR